MSTEAIKILQSLFKRNPDALRIFTLDNLEADGYKQQFRNNSELFASAINIYVTGRTGAGKTSLGNYLLSEIRVMKSTGYQDCTDFIGWFKLASNLRYYDLPGVVSGGYCANMNRVALLIERQIEDELNDPPKFTPFELSDELPVFDFTKCTSPEDKPEKEDMTVEQWQSEEQQQDIAPDIIIYVIAPHLHFLRPDKQYLGELLKSWKNRKNNCIIIPVLNIFQKEEKIFPTPQQIQYTRESIEKIYQKVYSNPEAIPIIEINGFTGKGFNKLKERIFQIIG